MSPENDCLYHTTYYACMYVCKYVCMHVCVYVCMYVCMHACMYVCCMYVCMYVCMDVCNRFILTSSPLMNNLLGVFVIRGRFLADVQKTPAVHSAAVPGSGSRSLLKTYLKIEKP